MTLSANRLERMKYDSSVLISLFLFFWLGSNTLLFDCFSCWCFGKQVSVTTCIFINSVCITSKILSFVILERNYFLRSLFSPLPRAQEQGATCVFLIWAGKQLSYKICGWAGIWTRKPCSHSKHICCAVLAVRLILIIYSCMLGRWIFSCYAEFLTAQV